MKASRFLFRESCLATHNTHRAKHGVPALKLSSELNRVAQVIIMVMIILMETCVLPNICRSDSNKVGEVVFHLIEK